MFNIEQLPTTLFAMGFDQEFINTCEYQYGSSFQSIFTSLYDGSLRGGQDYLRGFATFLCGAFTQHSQLRTNLNDAFERSLLNDGYRGVNWYGGEGGFESTRCMETKEFCGARPSK